MQPSDHDPDGIGIGANALSLNGGTITAQGSATNAALEIGAAAVSNAWVHKVNVGARPADDHGNDLSSATRVALPSETAGTVAPGNDADWFRFDVPTPSEVVVETTGDLVDTVGTLYDADGNMLAANDDSSTLNFRIQRTLDAGTYYVVVRSFGNATGSYLLRLAEAADHHGDSLATATSVALPSETGGAVAPGDDVDWFRFDVATRGGVTAESTGNLDTVGTLYDADGDELAVDDDSGADLNFHIQRTLDAGTYFMRVASFGGNTGRYALHLRSNDGGAAPSATAVGLHLRNLGDFDGDGKDDVLLRHEDGQWRYYPMDGRTVLVGNGGVSLTQDLAWQIAGIGDFDGDGRDDVLLRHEGGHWHFYAMDGRTVLAGSGPASLTAYLAWQIAGIGDLDGDGKDDVLLRHEDGHWHFYAMDGRDALAGSGPASLPADLAWRVAGVGDFDGDGRDDVLLRHEDGRWRYYRMDGRAVLAGGGMASLTTNPAWRVAGTDDLDGDGKDDVLLRHEDGRWRYYRMDGHAVLAGGGGVDMTTETTATVAGIGDLNGDGRADVLTRRADGSWYYYALDGRRLLSDSGEVPLTGNLAWGALSGGSSTGALTIGTLLPDQFLTLGRDESIDLWEAFVDDQTLTYEVQSSAPDVVRTSVTGDVLTLMPVTEGTATVTVTARDTDGNTATQTIAVTVDETIGDTFRDCAECPLMVRVPAGAFTMGSPESEALRQVNEGPQRTVSIQAFAASVHEVTFAEWDACADAGGCDGYRPDDAGWGRGTRPVINVSWDDAQLYVDWLSRSYGQHYRLLTESEWEYAARVGTRTPFHTGKTITPQQANFDGRYGYPAGEYNESGLYREQTVPVGSFAPNRFGLYDMHGNVWEQVQDCYYVSYARAPSDGSPVEERDSCGRVGRGGSWDDGPRSLPSANRGAGATVFRDVRIGFRVARTL